MSLVKIMFSVTSEEVVGDTVCNLWSLSFHVSLVECSEVSVHMFIYFHDTSFVAATAAVVGCAENSNHLAIMVPRVSLKKLQQ